MKALLLAATAIAALPAAAQAATVFSDSLQTPGSLTLPNWTSNNTGVIGAVPAGGNGLTFAGGGSGGDLFSKAIAGPGKYTVSFDYSCSRGAAGCAGFVGLAPGGSTTTNVGANPPNDGWLWTDQPVSYPTAFNSTATSAWSTVSFTFTVTSLGQWGLKLEDFAGGGGGIPGDAAFRNLSVTAVPEPAQWALLIGGFAFAGAALRRRGGMAAVTA